jgi:hypothetical protein
VERSAIVGNLQPRYRVLVADALGEGHGLVWLLRTREEAWWLEVQLEEALGITDAPVAGALER